MCMVGHPDLARAITQVFVSGDLDLSARQDAPTPGWRGMPEVAAAEALRECGASDVEVRLLLTLTMALDRARDADRLWARSAKLHVDEPWAFVPDEVVRRPLGELMDVLRSHGVSQRHTADAAAWRVICETLADTGRAPVVRAAVYDGHGDAEQLLAAVQDETPAGSPLFPLLRGPKIRAVWVRTLAEPGGAEIASLSVLPVAVDVQVRKVTEYLGVTDTQGVPLDEARPVIQEAWTRLVTMGGTDGPRSLAGTAAALDPALWFFGKWGCTTCERRRRRIPISRVCDACCYAGTPPLACGDK